MNPRFEAIKSIGKRTSPTSGSNSSIPSDCFGIHVFNNRVMQTMLPKEIYQNIRKAIEGQGRIKPEYADTIALSMKEWAISHGASHYTHWFQPLTGSFAEKHDSFIEWKSQDEVIERFTGKQLLQGEPDASSFPSGGLRSTYEARGYTGWDPTSPPFIWKGADGVTLCIPSVFFSWTGDVLDCKIPLLRSDKKINDAVMRLLKLTQIPANYIYSTLGLEQEYFVIDRNLRNLRQDLVLCGRTVFGAAPPKGQELQDHYFGPVQERILGFMQDFEIHALQLGIPVKTRHNEVAPAQHEVAPVFEKASTAIDHNLLLMEIMRRIAAKHHLSCLLHEKPFHDLNGSGKHANWSLSTDTGLNLLDPSDTPENQMHFLVLLTAILHAIHEHSILLRASIGSASNDVRLGGHEAPPAIISVYLGDQLEKFLNNIEDTGVHTSDSTHQNFDLGILVIPDLPKDNTDRNRTSPFAFTGNKFEFRALGSSSNPAFPITILNAIIAHSLNLMMDDIEAGIKEYGNCPFEELPNVIIPVVQKYLKASKPIRFSGDNYSKEWIEEAHRRHLSNIKKAIYAFDSLKLDKTIQAFQGILRKEELESRYEILTELYVHNLNIETKIMLDMFYTQILPIAIRQQKEMSKSLQTSLALQLSRSHYPFQTEILANYAEIIENAIQTAQELKEARVMAMEIESNAEKAKAFCEYVQPKCLILRNLVDSIEKNTDDSYWTLPKYREMLFLL